MKRIFCALLAVAMLFSLTACGQTIQTEEKPSGATRTFTDSVGRQVEIPEHIEGIIPSGNMAMMFLWPLAADKLVSVADKLTPEQMEYMGHRTDELPETGNLYKTGGTMNIEEVASLHADIMIDFGEPKANIASDLDELQALLGIPCVFIEGSLDTSADSYRMLGELLGMEEQAEPLAQYIEAVLDKVNTVMETAEKKSAVIFNGTDGLGCVVAGTYFDEVWSYMVQNAAVTEDAQMYSATSINFEQLAAWDPEYIFYYNGADPASAVDEAAWTSLRAVREGKCLEVPRLPYYLVYPPTVNRYLAMIWLGCTVYPELFDWDLRAETEKFYSLFYNCTLTDELYEKLMG